MYENERKGETGAEEVRENAVRGYPSVRRGRESERMRVEKRTQRISQRYTRDGIGEPFDIPKVLLIN